METYERSTELIQRRTWSFGRSDVKAETVCTVKREGKESLGRGKSTLQTSKLNRKKTWIGERHQLRVIGIQRVHEEGQCETGTGGKAREDILEIFGHQANSFFTYKPRTHMLDASAFFSLTMSLDLP